MAKTKGFTVEQAIRLVDRLLTDVKTASEAAARAEAFQREKETALRMAKADVDQFVSDTDAELPLVYGLDTTRVMVIDVDDSGELTFAVQPIIKLGKEGAK